MISLLSLCIFYFLTFGYNLFFLCEAFRGCCGGADGSSSAFTLCFTLLSGTGRDVTFLTVLQETPSRAE